MKHLDSIASTTGQMAIEMPGVPFVDFDNRVLAIAGVAVFAVGAIKSLRHQSETDFIINDQEYPQGSEYGEAINKSVKRGRAKGLGLGLVAAAGISSGVLAMAGPHDNKKVNEVSSVAVIIDAGYESYAEDVTGPGGEQEFRLPAIANTVKSMEIDGVDVSFVLAGVTPASAGTIRSGEGSNDVVDFINEYVKDLSQKGNPNNGGGNVETALSIAEQGAPDKIIIFTGSMEGNDQSPSVLDEELEAHDRVSVIAVGTPGSTVSTALGTYEAPINVDFNNSVVGEEDSYSATSTSELKDAVNDVINGQIQSTERNDKNIFRNIALIAGGLVMSARYLDFGRKNRNLKKK